MLNHAIFNIYDHGYTKTWSEAKLALFLRENERFLVRQLEMPAVFNTLTQGLKELPMEQFVQMLHEDNFDY